MRALFSALFAGLLLASVAFAKDPNGDDIVGFLMSSDPWGLSGAEIQAKLSIVDKAGVRSELAFVSKSMQHEPPLAKSLIRFSEPGDLAGASFLQIQKRDGDDERYLYLPDLKRARRISGKLRAEAFMGTDFSFADLDRRDIRESKAELKGKEKVGSHSCFVIDIVPRSADSQYSHIEAWVDEGNHLPLRMKMYDRTKTLLKAFEAVEIKRVSGEWFISKSRMVNEQQKHTTELVLQNIVVTKSFPEDEFSVRALEKQ